jgi:hypothetical protein
MIYLTFDSDIWLNSLKESGEENNFSASLGLPAPNHPGQAPCGCFHHAGNVPRNFPFNGMLPPAHRYSKGGVQSLPYQK